MIGQLENEPKARVLSDYLRVRGIYNQIENEADGSWSVWIHNEDDLDKARGILAQFQANPNDPEIRQQAIRARELVEEDKRREEEAARRMFTKNRIFREHRLFGGMGPLTLALVAISVVVYVVSEVGANSNNVAKFLSYLYISAMRGAHDLPEVRTGQIWRLITPIFLHFGIIHIFFNMMWMKDLGTMIEARLGSLHLARLVVGIAIISNVGGYFFIGPMFGGMSGVIYGLLGYVWMKGKYDPSSGLFLHPSTVSMMLIWYVLCFFLNMGGGGVSIANSVHTFGLISGVVWGYLSAQRSA